MATHGTVTQLHFAPRSTGRPAAHGAWAALTAMVRARRTRRLLAEMDDRMLADIGLDRGQALAEAARPAWDVAARH